MFGALFFKQVDTIILQEEFFLVKISAVLCILDEKAFSSLSSQTYENIKCISAKIFKIQSLKKRRK